MIIPPRGVIKSPYPTWTQYFASNSPVIIGHRGGTDQIFPENTIPCMAANRDHGFPIELDIQESNDHNLIIIHDTSVNRTCSPATGNVSDYLTEELKYLDAGKWINTKFTNTPVPTLAEVFDYFRDSLLYFIDIKFSLGKCATDIIKRRLQPYCIVNIWSWTDADTVKAADSSIACARGYYSGDDLSTAIADAVAHNVEYLNIDQYNAGLTQAFVDTAHAAGLKIVVWTVKSKYMMNKLPTGIDAFICKTPVYLSNKFTINNFSTPYTFDFTNKDYFSSRWLTNTTEGPPLNIKRGSGYLSKTGTSDSAAQWCTYVGNTLINNITTKITYTFTPRALNADNNKYAGIQILQCDEAILTKTPTNVGQSGYEFYWTQNGTLTINRYTSGVNYTSIKWTLSTGNMVVDTPVTFEVTLESAAAGNKVRIKRLDTNAYAEIVDGNFRGGNIAFVWNGVAGDFSNVVVTT